MSKHSTSVDIAVFLAAALFLAIVAAGVLISVNHNFGFL